MVTSCENDYQKRVLCNCVTDIKCYYPAILYWGVYLPNPKLSQQLILDYLRV